MARKRNTFGSIPVAKPGQNGRLSEFYRKRTLYLKVSDGLAMTSAGEMVEFNPETKVKAS